jgi:hypothetical protein
MSAIHIFEESANEVSLPTLDSLIVYIRKVNEGLQMKLRNSDQVLKPQFSTFGKQNVYSYSPKLLSVA